MLQYELALYVMAHFARETQVMLWAYECSLSDRAATAIAKLLSAPGSTTRPLTSVCSSWSVHILCISFVYFGLTT